MISLVALLASSTADAQKQYAFGKRTAETLTSDVAVLRSAKRRGAAVITSEGFIRKMETALSQDNTGQEMTREKSTNYKSRKKISLDKL